MKRRRPTRRSSCTSTCTPLASTPSAAAGRWSMAGRTMPCTWFVCKHPGCPRGPAHLIKQVGSATGQLYKHLEVCMHAIEPSPMPSRFTKFYCLLECVERSCTVYLSGWARPTLFHTVYSSKHECPTLSLRVGRFPLYQVRRWSTV